MSRNGRFLFRLAAAVATIGVAISLLAHRWIGGRPPNHVAELAEKGAAAFRLIEIAPMESEAQLLSVLSTNAPFRSDSSAPDLTADQHKALLAATAKFLWLYYGKSEPDEYIAWRQNTGYALIATDEMVNSFGAAQGYKFYFGQEMPPGMTEEQLYRRVWTAHHECCEGTNDATGLANDRRGIVVQYNLLSNSNPRVGISIAGEFDTEVWQGARTICGRTWWKSRSGDMLQKDLNESLVGVLAVVLEFRDGSRKPLFLQWHWNASESAWHLSNVSVTNVAAKNVGAPEW